MNHLYKQLISVFTTVSTLESCLVADFSSDISAAELNVLSMLYFKNIKQHKDLVIELKMGNGLASKYIKSLYIKNLIDIYTDKNDKRIKYFEISEEGKKIVIGMNQKAEKLMKEIAGNLSKEQQEKFLESLQLFSDVISPALEQCRKNKD